MPATVDDLRCHWRWCSSPGPYADDKALYDHLVRQHRGAARDNFICLWEGCPTARLTSGSDRTRHLLSHTTYRPFVCKQPGCTGKAYKRRAALVHHHLSKHHDLGTDDESGSSSSSDDDSGSSSGSDDEDGDSASSNNSDASDSDSDSDAQVSASEAPPEHTARVECLWGDCAESFSGDSAGAAALWEHLAVAHYPAQKCKCQWGACRMELHHVVYKSHVRTHLPDWYRPFVCEMCERSFARSSALNNHHRLTHPSSLGKRVLEDSLEAEDAKSPRKKRKSSRGTRIDSSSARGSTVAVDELPTSAERRAATRAPVIAFDKSALVGDVEGPAIGKLGSGSTATCLEERLLSAEAKIQQLEVQVRELLRGEAAAPAESSANDQLLDPTLFAYED